MSYTTTSGFSDLVGSCEISGDNVTSYYSDARGTGTVTNLGGSGLRFRVSFSGVPRPYVINANANGAGGFDGNANDNGPEEAEESWAATATKAEAAYGKGE
jgi:hypothetical protein